MATPHNERNIFNLIAQGSRVTKVTRNHAKLCDFVETELTKYRQNYDFMKNVTVRDYLKYRFNSIADEQEIVPKPTAQQFWDAAFDLNPLEGSVGTVTQLQKYLSLKTLDAIPLGRYGGLAKLELIPGIGALPNTERLEKFTNFRFAATDSGAISYPDGYPSEFEDDSFRVKSSQDEKLRRFASLGWAIYVLPDGTWSRTGHVLVMDMDVTRSHHPWLVLASEWPTDQEDAKGNFTASAPKTVPSDDPNQPGILPGGKTRTPLGKVIPMYESGDGPVLKRFGPDFDFRVKRPGGDRSYDRDPTRGPDLAHIMHWYWDPATDEEVCFYKDGSLEYMRYDRKSKYYTYPSMRILRGLVIGEAGLLGVLAGLVAPAGRFIPRSERMAPPPATLPWGRHRQEYSIQETY